MVFKNLAKFTKSLEDPQNPLLGPAINALYCFGLWQTGTKFRTIGYTLIHFSTLLFVFTEFVDLYTLRRDINKVISNMSLTVLSVICVAKSFSYILWQKQWRELVQEISKEELFQIQKKDRLVKKLMNEYTQYTRKITYFYWFLVFVTNLLLILTTFLRYLTSASYREEIEMGKEPLPQIMFSWFPFDNNKNPGYVIGILVHIFIAFQGSGVIAGYDMTAVGIMSYLKGHMIIIREQCKRLFDDTSSTETIIERIKECHRHHNVLIKNCKEFNGLLSSTMFLYVLMCAITICGSVVQFTSKEATSSQKLWVIQYTVALVAQLFIYCWHGNEVTLEADRIDEGIFNSDWWKGDVRVRKHLLLLAGKFTHRFVLQAGPYTTLSVSTFVEIMKRSYSFVTLFSQMQGN